MNRKTLATGILLLFIGGILSPVAFGFNVEVSEDDTFLDEIEFASVPYTSDSTESKTVVISEYLNPQPTALLDNGLMNSSWPMKCHDLHHTSRSPYNADDGDGLEKWRFKPEFLHVESSAVIDDQGIIYFGSFDHKLHALNLDGSLKWEYETGGRIWSAPALAEDGTIYIGSWDRNLHAVNPDGTQKWAVDVGAVISSSPAIAPDGSIYFSTMTEPPLGHSLIAVNPNGTIQWRYLTGNDMTSDPAIGDDGAIYVGSQDTYFYAINPNGTLKWRFKTGDIISGSPAIADDGTIYISSYDGWLYALNPDNGSVLWKYTDGGDEGSPALGPDGIIYLGNSRLRAIFPNGTLKYSVDIGPNIGSASPALSADGILYVGAGNQIIAVDSDDGSVIWRKTIANEGVYSSPIIGTDGTIYIGSDSLKRRYIDGYQSLGYLHAFGPVTSNSPPETPVIDGKPKGAAGETYLYTFTTSDPDNNPVSFYIDWGDGNTANWTTEAANGETIYLIHEFAEEDTYTIRCKARDTLGEESDWGTLTVKMPHAYSYPFLNRMVNRFPLLTRLLSLFIKDTTQIPEIQTKPSFLPETQHDQYDFMRMTYNDYQKCDTYLASNSQTLSGGLE